MRDAASGRSVPDEQAQLAGHDENDAQPQARDERPITVSSEEHTEEPDKSDIESWREQYNTNPLIGVPVQNFASDVTEPGHAAIVERDTDEEDADAPTVRDEYPDSTYAGMELDAALEHWLSNCYIDGWDFDADFSDLLQSVVKDRRGRRGTAIVEHAYDDPTERQRVLGLRPIKTETVTAYTREGKAIVLRPDDSIAEDSEYNGFESVAVDDLGDNSRDEAPKTPAGKTAAIAQYDDIFGASEREEIPFALSDITVSAYNADTGHLFGEPDTALVVDRAAAVKEKLERVGQGVLNAAFSNIIARVDSADEDVVRSVRDNLDPNSPETVSATNAPVELEEVDGSVPDAVDTIQQEIEFVLSAMPTPLYRVGFAGDINRDITGEQQDDYRDLVRRERTRLEADFQKVLRQKAAEFLEGDPHASLPDDVDVRLEIRPDDAESPLKDEEFDPEAFQQLMNGLSTAAGPKGGADAVIPRRVIIDTLLDMDADELLGEPMGDQGASALEPANEADPAVRDAFEEFTGAKLASRYEPGEDMVDTPDGTGLVVETITETQEIDDNENLPDRVEASPDSPTYVVIVPEQTPPIGLYKAADLEMAEVSPDVDPVNSLSDEAAEAMASGCAECETAELGDWSPPQSWRNSSTPARVIALDAFQSMGGDFDGCVREMRGSVSRPENFCGAFLDHVFGGYTYWRGDSFLPGD